MRTPLETLKASNIVELLQDRVENYNGYYVGTEYEIAHVTVIINDDTRELSIRFVEGNIQEFNGLMSLVHFIEDETEEAHIETQR